MKERCPHCGKRTISVFNKLMGWFIFPHCKHCHKMYSTYAPAKKLNIFFDILVLFVSIIGIGIGGLGGKPRSTARRWREMMFSFIPYRVALIVSCAVFVLALLYMIMCAVFSSVIPCQNWHEKGITLPRANVQLKTDRPRKLKKYRMYDIKFNPADTTEEFHKSFSEGVVPAFFTSSGINRVFHDMRLLNIESLPENLLQIGTKVSIERNGKHLFDAVIENVMYEKPVEEEEEKEL